MGAGTRAPRGPPRWPDTPTSPAGCLTAHPSCLRVTAELRLPVQGRWADKQKDRTPTPPPRLGSPGFRGHLLSPVLSPVPHTVPSQTHLLWAIIQSSVYISTAALTWASSFLRQMKSG